MPRRPRIKLAGMPQHIVQCGINRESCFFPEEDYQQAKQISCSVWRCKRILDSEQERMNMAFCGKINARLTPLVRFAPFAWRCPMRLILPKSTGMTEKRGFFSNWKLLLGLFGVIAFAMLLLTPGRTYPPTPDDHVVLPYSLPGKYEGTPVPLHLGNTHFSLAVDYLNVLTPRVGQGFSLQAAWPSMRSLDEEVTVNPKIKIEGQLGGGFVLHDSLLLRFDPIGSNGFTDNYRSYVLESVQLKQFETERLDELGLYRQHRGGYVLYWAIDEKVATPYQKLPYAFICDAGGDSVAGQKKELQPSGSCTGGFQVNQDFSVKISFNHNPRHLKDWQAMYFKVLEFIKSIEVAQK